MSQDILVPELQGATHEAHEEFCLHLVSIRDSFLVRIRGGKEWNTVLDACNLSLAWWYKPLS
jgi:hypothetical protein